MQGLHRPTVGRAAEGCGSAHTGASDRSATSRYGPPSTPRCGAVQASYGFCRRIFSGAGPTVRIDLTFQGRRRQLALRKEDREGCEDLTERWRSPRRRTSRANQCPLN